MLWRGMGSVLAGCGAGSLVLLTVWLWPGQSVPPSMGPAVVVPVLHGPTPSSTAAPGPVHPTAIPPAPLPGTSWGGRPVSPSPPPAAEDVTDESREGPGDSGHEGGSPIADDDEAASRAPRGEVDDDDQDDEDEQDDEGEVFPGRRGDAGDEWDD